MGQEAEDRQQPHILVVDDEEDVRVYLDKFLTNQGWRCSTVGSDNECLDFLRDNRPDLIILDIIMPGVDGYHTCYKIKENPELKDIPVIIHSAKTEAFQQEKGHMVGADAYLCKPCEGSELLRTCSELLSNELSQGEPSDR